MVEIVKSTFREEHKQKDGRFWVHERHELSDGTSREYSFLADADLDVPFAVFDRASAIREELAREEVADKNRKEARTPALAAAMDEYGKITKGEWAGDPEKSVARLIDAALEKVDT